LSYTAIYVHVVFAVKRRCPVLASGKRQLLFSHIKEQAALHQICLLQINGFEDHIHLLLRLHASQPLSAVIQQIKGESARWANQVLLFDVTLKWAAGYYARSVDPDNIGLVTRYIASQPFKHSDEFCDIIQYLSLVAINRDFNTPE
jgi:putative transposase